jgi:hypothetical protein
MLIENFPIIAAWTNAAVFAVAGLINVTAVGRVRRFYTDWDVPIGFYRGLGVVEFIAAIFLVTPSLRIWGIALAGPIMFGAIVMLLDHRHYLYAVSAMLVMSALVPAAATLPHSQIDVASAPASEMTITLESGNEAALTAVFASHIADH